VAKVRTSNPDRTISLKMLQCVVENTHVLKVINLHLFVPHERKAPKCDILTLLEQLKSNPLFYAIR